METRHCSACPRPVVAFCDLEEGGEGLFVLSFELCEEHAKEWESKGLPVEWVDD